MSILNHALLPQDFAAPANRIILEEPQHEYFFARMAYASAARAELMMMDYDFGFAEHKIPDAGAGYPQEIAALALGANPMAAAINSRVVIEANQGDTVSVERPIYDGGGYTKAARAVNTRDTIATEGLEINDAQAKMTLELYIGPHSSTGSGPQPYAVNLRSAKTQVNSIAQKVGHHMKRDRQAWLNAVMLDHFSRGSIVYTDPTITSIDGYTTDTAGLLNVDTFWRVQEEMRSNTAAGNIPPFANGQYLACITPTQARQLKGDPEFGDYAKEERDANPLYNTIARIGLIDIVEVAHVTRATNASSVQIEYGIVLGPGSVGHAINMAPEVRHSDNTNYGFQARVIWAAIEAMETLDNRFQRRIATTNDSGLTFLSS